MTKKQKVVLERLVKLAGGNPLLVEESLRAASKKKDASFADLIDYIKQHREAA